MNKKLWPDFVVINNGKIREMVDFYPTHYDNASLQYVQAVRAGSVWRVVWANGNTGTFESLPAEFLAM